MPARILSMRIQASAGHIAAVLIRSLSFLTSSLPLQLFARQCLRYALVIFACAFLRSCPRCRRVALHIGPSLRRRWADLFHAVALRLLSLPPRCRAGPCRCFSVRFSAAAQVGPAHCLCAADLTFAFAVLSCARPLLFCPHLCRCCSLPNMAFLCRRTSALVFADAFRHDSLPPPLVPEHCHAMPPPCKSCPCRRLSMQCSSLLFRRCSWRSNSLPPQINPMHIMASAARSCALLTLPPLRHAKLRVSMPPPFGSTLCLCLSQRDSAFPLLVLP